MDLRQSCWADGPEESGRVGNWGLMKFSKIRQGLSQDRRGVINSGVSYQRWTRMVREHLPCSEGLREPGADTALEEISDLAPWGHQGCVTCTEVQGRRNSSGQVLKQERFRLEIGKSIDILRHWKFPQRCWAVCSWRFLIWGWLNPGKPRLASELSLFEQEFGLQNSSGPFLAWNTLWSSDSDQIKQLIISLRKKKIKKVIQVWCGNEHAGAKAHELHWPETRAAYLSACKVIIS